MPARSIEITLSDVFGNSIEFHDSREIREFLETEREKWAWLAEAAHSPPTPNMHAEFNDAFDESLEWIEQFEQEDTDEEDLIGYLQPVYAKRNPRLLFSDYAPGHNVQLIKHEFGSNEGERALSFATGRVEPSLHVLADFRLWIRVALPSLAKGEAWTDDLRKRLVKTRENLQAEVRSHRKSLNDLISHWAAKNTSDRKRYFRFAKYSLREGNNRASAISQAAMREITTIRGIQASYQEQMRLQAPVEYWFEKSKAHADSASNWGIALCWYVAGVVAIAALGFNAAWTAFSNDTELTGRHFMLVAVIGASLTLMFWGARLIVRIYLGERHLYTDAEERRVMTQAYLALIKDAAASDQERIVILSALFRTANDGIIKDDGAGDISLPAMVARLLDAKK